MKGCLMASVARIICVLLTTLVCSCVVKHSLEQKYEASLEIHQSFLSKYGPSDWGYETYKQILEKLLAYGVDDLPELEIVYVGINPERRVFVINWIGKNTYIDRVEFGGDGWQIEIDLNEVELNAQFNRSEEFVDSATTFQIEKDLEYELSHNSLTWVRVGRGEEVFSSQFDELVWLKD